MAQTGPFGAPSLASFVAGASFEADASPRDVDTDIAPRASTHAGIAPSPSPVREIDVDLSPGGLENVSMTMRLTGDKLSVVIRAASSQTLGSIEGARDAIADRMAAIGQPLDSLIVKQAGVNTDGSTNGNTGGSAEGERRSEQGAGERDGSDDALSRRGADRDRSF
jgi:Flagellar hook-length control protein FliK